MASDAERHVKDIKVLQGLMKKVLASGGYSRKEEQKQLNRLGRQLAAEEEMIAAGEVEDTTHRDFIQREMELVKAHWDLKRRKAYLVADAWEAEIAKQQAEMDALEEED